MKLIKKTIDINNRISFINIPLTDNPHLIGEDQSMDKIADDNIQININPVNDVETFKFKISSQPILNFNFGYNNSLGVVGSEYTTYQAAFKINASVPTNITSSMILNSYYVMDIYDGINIQSQNKLGRNYLTNLDDSKTTYNLGINPNQFNNIFLSNKFMNSKPTSTFKVYCKFMFYDAKNGRVITFFNYNNRNLTTNNKLYFEIDVNKTSRSWEFTEGLVINAYGNVNGSYSQKVSDTIGKQKNLVEEFPVGNTFDYENVNYKTI